MGVPITDPLAQLSLSPGFRFYPTDEELLVQYLCNKVAGRPFSSQIIGEIELYKYDPWVLPSKAMFGEKEWYFFTPRDRKYPNGSRPNRIAGSGYWKATGTDKVITTGERKIGIKKTLVFYIGKAPKGTKTNWIMHEYRLLNSTCKSGSSKLDEWVLCRIYKKNSGGQKPTSTIMSTKGHLTNCSSSSSSSQTDHHGDVMHSVPEIDDRPNVNNQPMGSTSFDWAILAGLSSVPEIGPVQPNQGLFGYADDAIDRYVPSGLSISMMNCGGSVEEEVQFGLRNQRVGNPGNYFQLNQGDLTRNFSNSVEPYELRFPAQPDSGYGFRQ